MKIALAFLMILAPKKIFGFALKDTFSVLSSELAYSQEVILDHQMSFLNDSIFMIMITIFVEIFINFRTICRIGYLFPPSWATYWVWRQRSNC